MCLGGGALCLTLGWDQDPGSIFSTRRYLASMSLRSLPSAGNLNLTTHKLFDGDTGKASGASGSPPLSGGILPHFLQQQPARLCQGRDASMPWVYLDCILKGSPERL